MQYLLHLFLLVFLGNISVHLSAQQQDWKEVEGIGFSSYQHPFVEVVEDNRTYLYHLDSQIIVDGTEDHSAEFIVVVKDGKYGVFRTDGKLILPFEYDEINLQCEYTGQWYPGIPYLYKFIILKKDGLYGYADENGNILALPQYQNIKIISRVIVAMQQNHLWGWMEASTGEIHQPCQYEDVGRMYFSDYIIEIEQQNQVGLAKLDGEVLIPMEYDALYSYITAKDTYIAATKDKSQVLHDTLGQVKLSRHFDDLKPMRYTALFRYKHNNQYGLLDPSTGSIISEPVYTSIREGLRGLYIIEQNKQYGVVNDKGKIVVPIIYEQIDFLNADNSLRSDDIIRGPEDYGKHGNPITDEFRSRILRDSIINSLPYCIRVKKDNTEGIFDWQGKELVPTGIYTQVHTHYHEGTFFRVNKGEKFGLLNSAGQEILATDYYADRSYQYLWASIENQKDLISRYIPFGKAGDKESYLAEIGLFDLETARIVVSPTTQHIEWLSETCLKVTKVMADYQQYISLYNHEGKLIHDFGQEVDNIHHILSNNLLLVEKQGHYQMTDWKGNILYSNPKWQTSGHYTPVHFPKVNDLRTGNFYTGLKKIYADEGPLFVNEQGQEKRFDDYDYVDDFYTGTALFAKKTPDADSYSGFNYRFGLIDWEGNELHAAEWDRVSGFANHRHLLLVEKNEKWGLINRNGNYILPMAYEYIESTDSYPTLQIMQQDKYGLVTVDGSLVIKPHYDRLYRCTNGEENTWPLLVQDGEWHYFINKDGKPYPIRSKQRTY